MPYGGTVGLAEIAAVEAGLPKAVLQKVRALVAALPCEHYRQPAGPEHCKRCQALALIDEVKR